MKKLLLFAAVLAFVSLANTAIAQDEKGKEKEKKESQEIVIRKKGDKDTKIIVEINGDKVTINGKPLSDFKDDDITINKRKVTVWDRNGSKGFEFVPGGDFGAMDSFSWNDDETPHAFLGVTTDDDDNGAKVTEITKESAAEKAGLKKDDIITKIGDKKVDGPGSLSDVVRSFKPKEEVTVYYKRDGKENSSRVTMGESKGSAPFAYSLSTPGMARSFSSPYIPKVRGLNGIPKVEAWADGQSGNFNFYGDMLGRHQKLGLKIQDTEDGAGVKVLEVDKDSPAEKAGLKKDDVLTEVGGKKVANTDEARQQLQENSDKSAYNVKAKRNGSEMSFDIKIPKKLKTANL